MSRGFRLLNIAYFVEYLARVTKSDLRICFLILG
jgi:hypothetical protein